MPELIVIRGPLTDDDLRGIIEAVKRAEERQPDQTFTVVFDEPDDGAEQLMARFDELNPLRPGYERTLARTSKGATQFEVSMVVPADRVIEVLGALPDGVAHDLRIEEVLE